MGVQPSVMMKVETNLFIKRYTLIYQRSTWESLSGVLILQPMLKGAVQPLAQNIPLAFVHQTAVMHFSNVLERKPAAVSQSHFLSQMGTTNLRTLESLFAVYTRLLDFRVQRF